MVADLNFASSGQEKINTMITEVVTLPIRDEGIARPNLSSIEALRSILSTVAKQSGFNGAYWGQELGKTNIFRLFVQWETIAAHMNFQKKDYYKSFIEALDQVVVVSEITAYYVQLVSKPPGPSMVFQSPQAVEVISLYLHNDCTSSDQTRLENKVTQFVRTATKDHPNLAGVHCGWVEEELATPASTTKAKPYIACFAWRSFLQSSEIGDKRSENSIEHAVSDIEQLEHIQVVQMNGATVHRGEVF